MRRYRSGHWLEVKYWKEGLTQQEIAEECGVSPRAIRKYMEKFGIPTREIRGENHPLYGRERAEATKEKISESLDGRSLSEETRQQIAQAHRGREPPENVREKISESLKGLTRSKETRRRMSESTAGERNPNWQGGYSNCYGSGWSVAREDVRERDEVCQHCGHDGSEYRLEVHHIVPVRLFRQSENCSTKDAHCEENLVLLCKRCHGRAEHGKITLDAPIELLFETERESGRDRHAKPHHADRTI